MTTEQNSALLKSDEKVQSRYLKPSTTSCHDYCKHGKKHESEDASQNLHNFLKNKRTQDKPTIRPKMESDNLPKSKKSPALTKKIKCQIAQHVKKQSNSSPDELSAVSDTSDTDIIMETTKSPTVDSSVASTKSKRKASPSPIKKIPSTNQKAPLPSKRVDDAVSKMKPPLVVRSISIARRNHEKNTSKLGTVASKPLNTLKSTKALFMRSISRKRQDKINGDWSSSKTKTPPVSASLSLVDQGNLEKSKNPQRSMLKKIAASLSSKAPNDDDVSSLKPGKPRTEKRSFSFKSKLRVEGDTRNDPETKNSVLSRGVSKRGSRRTRQENDIVPAPYKLNFRQGKVMDLRSDSLRAKRLWFRVGKTAGENTNGNTVSRRRSFRKKVTDSNMQVSETEIVILKHQKTLRKKNAQALFNHVIEETASKLVKTRKSKVKALVGAFETVISLQETKPASAVRS